MPVIPILTGILGQLRGTQVLVGDRDGIPTGTVVGEVIVGASFRTLLFRGDHPLLHGGWGLGLGPELHGECNGKQQDGVMQRVTLHWDGECLMRGQTKYSFRPPPAR